MLSRPNPKHFIGKSLSHEVHAFEIEHHLAKLIEAMDEPFRLRSAHELGPNGKEPNDDPCFAQ